MAYIGVTTDYKSRQGNHINELLKNKHYCKPLQMDFNKYGLSWFVFDVLEINDDEIKEHSEHRHLRNYDKRKLYNSHDGKCNRETEKKKTLAKKLNKWRASNPSKVKKIYKKTNKLEKRLK